MFFGGYVGIQKDDLPLPDKLERIKSLLDVAFSPLVCDVINESHMHSRGNETHYKVIVVTDGFNGLGRVKRHQKVYAALGELMGQIHALAIHAYTPDEWTEIDAVHESPICSGGSKFDR